MTYMQALLGFAVLAGAMAMVPGLDMVMTMNEAIHYGGIRHPMRRAGMGRRRVIGPGRTDFRIPAGL